MIIIGVAKEEAKIQKQRYNLSSLICDACEEEATVKLKEEVRKVFKIGGEIVY